MYQKKLPDAWNQFKLSIFGSALQEMLWGPGSLVRLQKLRHKLIFSKEMYKGMNFKFLVRICCRYPSQFSRIVKFYLK